jgi:cysteine desulfurase
MIYLDYNATTPIDPAVREAMLPYLGEWYGNPSSTHAQGRACAAAIATAREQVAMLLGTELLGAKTSEVVFTAGGTESNNLAILGTMCREPAANGRHLVISSLEHPATIEPAKFLEQQGYAVSVVGCDATGTIDPAEVAAALRPETALVSIMHANNEIGSVQPIRAIADLCHAQGVLVHTDTAQSAGKISVRVDELGVDFLSLAGHKFYAPKGVGALYMRSGTQLAPVLHGAGQEAGIRPGTENVAFIVGLGVAAKLAAEGLGEANSHMQAMRDRLELLLQKAIGAGFSVNAADAQRLPNTLSGNFPGVTGVELLEHTPSLLASTGAACHSGETKLSATLAAIGLEKDIARGTVRLSVGRHTTADEIDSAAEQLIGAWKKLQARHSS